MAGSITAQEVPAAIAVSNDTRPVDAATASRLPAVDAREVNPSETAVPDATLKEFGVGSAVTEQA